MDRNDLVGAWELMGMENHSDDGTVTYPWGRDAVGKILYTADGSMAVFIAKPDRVPFAAGDIYAGTAEELLGAARQWISYCGRYTFHDGVVTHHVELSFFPNWVGQDQKRYVILDGDTLTLSTDRLMLDGEFRVAKLVWKRLT